MSADLTRIERAYERGRARRALFHALPIALLVAMMSKVSSHASWTAGIGAALVGAAVICLWRGLALGRVVPPAVCAGCVPLVAAMVTMRIGHLCTPAGCATLCVPVCFAGALFAGGWIAHTARDAGRVPLAVGAGLALLTGALGCVAVGAGGIVGLGAGLFLTTVPAMVRRSPA